MFQGAKNLDGAWTALGMDLIPPLATVNLTSPKAQGPPPPAQLEMCRPCTDISVHVIDIRVWV